MKKETVGYILLALGFMALLVGWGLIEFGSSVRNAATGQIWEMSWFRRDTGHMETRYVTAEDFAAFWALLLGGAALFILGIKRIPRTPRGR